MDVFGRNGKYSLESKPLAEGGEGQVYRIVGNKDKVVKIYTRKSESIEKKIILMMKKPPSQKVMNQVAWPIDIVYNSSKEFCGFVMPMLDITDELSNVYDFPPSSDITFEQKIILAQNICAVINEVHKAGYIFGDFNPRNIGVNLKTGSVAFLDTDSYHIVYGKNKAFRCNVCASGYAAPELLEKVSKHIGTYPEDKTAGYAKTPLDTFTRDTDHFALAIHIFRLLMNGFLPFSGVPKDATGSGAKPGVGDEAVKNDNYCFKPGFKSIAVAIPPMEIHPKSIQALFYRAFVDGKENPNRRPSAQEWYRELEKYEKELVNCKKHSTHMYRKGLKSCPWCDANNRYRENLNPSLIQKRFDKPVTKYSATNAIPATKMNQAAMATQITQAAPYRQTQNQGNTYTGQFIPNTNVQSQQMNHGIQTGSGYIRKRTKEKAAPWIDAIGWIIFAASVIYVAYPFFEGGSFHIDNAGIYWYDVFWTGSIVIGSTFVLALCTAFNRNKFGDLAKVFGGVFGLAYSIISGVIATKTSPAEKTIDCVTAFLTPFLILSVLTGLALFFGVIIGKKIGINAQNGYISSFKKGFPLAEVILTIALIVMTGVSASLFIGGNQFVNIENVNKYYETNNLLIILAGVGLILFPFVTQMIDLRGNSALGWYGAFTTCTITWITLLLPRFGAMGFLFMGFALLVGVIYYSFLMGEIFEPLMVSYIATVITGAIVDFMTIPRYGDAFKLAKYFDKMEKVPDVLKYIAVAPAVISIIVAIGFSIGDAVKKAKA